MLVLGSWFFLWTVSVLDAAAQLYTSLGFRPTAQRTHLIWGQQLTEVRYDLALPAASAVRVDGWMRKHFV